MRLLAKMIWFTFKASLWVSFLITFLSIATFKHYRSIRKQAS